MKILKMAAIGLTLSLSGCIWGTWEQDKILPASNSVFDLQVLVPSPNIPVSLTCVDSTWLYITSANNDIGQLEAWMRSTNNYTDPLVPLKLMANNGTTVIGNAVMNSDASATIVDSGGTKLYSAVFHNASLMSAKTVPTLGSCWSTFAHYMNNNDPYYWWKARIVAHWTENGQRKYAPVYTKAQGTCISEKVLGGQTFLAANLNCVSTLRNTLGIYALQ